MPLEHFCPRLSEAKTFLPLLRAELLAAAPRHTLPLGLSLELLPIAEDGLFGYELVPDRETRRMFRLVVMRQVEQSCAGRATLRTHRAHCASQR